MLRRNFLKNYITAKKFTFLATFVFLALSLSALNMPKSDAQKIDVLAVNEASGNAQEIALTSNNTPVQEIITQQSSEQQNIASADDVQVLSSTELSNKQYTKETALTPGIIDQNAGEPVSLSIPKINVSAKVLHIGLTPEGAVGVPESAFDVSWFNLGAKPGQAGNALISGHTGIWKDGTHSIFDQLHTLQPGDKIYIKDDIGKTLTFTVQSTKVYNKDDVVPELFIPSNTANLNIITCHGTWLPSQKTYSQRFVLFTKLTAIN